MGIGALNYQGVKGGLKLNDVIEEFKYVYQGQTIKAGDFVEYVKGIASQTVETSSDVTLSTESHRGYTISAIQLDESRVFIVHSTSTQENTNLYGMIVTINGTNMTVATDIELISGARNYCVSMVKLDDKRVFIAYAYGGTAFLYGVVATINGTTISTGTGLQLNTTNATGQKVSLQLLPSGKVFLAYRYGNDYRLYGMIITINGETITKGIDTKLNSSGYSGYELSTQLLPNGNVFIAHSNNSSGYYLYGLVVTISGTTITSSGSSTSLNTTEYAGIRISTQLLPNGNVFIAHSRDDDYHLYGMIVTISGTTVTKGTDYAISSTAYTGYVISTQLLPNGNVFIAHSYGSNYYLYGIIAIINGTAVTKGTDTLISNTTYAGKIISSIFLPNGSIFVAHSYGDYHYLHAQIFGIDETNNIPTNIVTLTEYEQQAKLATKPPFNGIALSNGTGGTATAHNQQVKIARPNV